MEKGEAEEKRRPFFREIRRYYCEYCGICRSKKTLIASHILAQHKDEMDWDKGDEEVEVDKCNTCEECGASFNKPAYLKQHMLSHSLEFWYVLASIEDRGFAGINLFKLTIPFGWREALDPTKELQNARGYGLEWTSTRGETSCEAPSSDPQSRSVAIKRHVVELHSEDCPSTSIEGQKQHVCQEPGCGKVFQFASKLRKHKDSHVKLDSVEAFCSEPDCMKYFSNKQCLQDHIQSCHTHITCEICGKKEWKKNIRSHLRTHEEGASSLEIKCEYEGSLHTFTKKSNLLQHVKAVHLQQKPFSCSFSGCSKTFSYKHVRDKHEKSECHVYAYGDFEEADEQFRSRPRGGRKRMCPTVEMLVRKRVTPPDQFGPETEFLSQFFSQEEMAEILISLMGLLLLCLCIEIMTMTAEAECMKYKDPNQPLNTRINDLLSRMTLEEKIGQMTQIDRSVASPEVMYKYNIGSVLSGGGSVPAKNASAETWIRMVNDFQNGSLSTRLSIPLIYGIDAIHGHNNVYKATIFPHNVGLGATRKVDMEPILNFRGSKNVPTLNPPGTLTLLRGLELQLRLKLELQEFIIPLHLVCRDPRWGCCYESYSEDPRLVHAMTEIIPGLQGKIPANSRKGVPYVSGNDKVAACAKHYVGDGGTAMGINENNAMHANRELITGFLKGTLGFKGFVISDWQGIDMITSPSHSNYSYSIMKGISAGIDMIMVPYNYTEFIEGLTFQVKNKIIPMSRIDDAVKKILRVKFTMGLFEKPLADLRLVSQLGSLEHRELAREAVRRSLVLLKNGECAEKPILPLPKKTSKILVAGTHADNLGYQCGGWTIEWQGHSGNNLTHGTTVLSALRNTVAPETRVVYKKNPDAKFMKSNNFSHAIVIVGEPPYAEGAGDNPNLTIPKSGRRVIRNVCGAATYVVCLITGRPVVIKPYLSNTDALVAAWLPGTEAKELLMFCLVTMASLASFLAPGSNLCISCL
ncbi:hypothetical protein ACLB2K_042627 [Fragaria x ananassa]